MWATALKAIQALRLLKDKGTRNLGKKVLIVLLSPVIAFIFLIGGIFSDGINFNHNLIQDLYNGKPVSTVDMDVGQRKQVKDIETGIKLINLEIEEVNKTLTDGSLLDNHLVKGFYIGLMLTDQSFALDQAKANSWVLCFTEEKEEVASSEEKDEQPKEEETTVERTSLMDTTKIFAQIDSTFSITLKDDVKGNMESVYSALMGGTTNKPVTTLSKEEIDKLIKNLPKDTSEVRKNLVIQAADAVGKIPYYWGGAASVPGYEGNDFGIVTSPDEHGRILKGMDCSHFVDWVYWTVMGNNLGNTNTTGQIAQSYEISKDELQVGDLAFLMENGVSTHVGIYAGKNEKGEAVWIHENAADVNVAMNTVNYWNLYCRLNFMKGR
ncbi:C40 family peptidase [Amedibacillus sp. YH-ame10]